MMFFFWAVAILFFVIPVSMLILVGFLLVTGKDKIDEFDEN